MTLTFTVTLDVDKVLWAQEFGIELHEVSEDAESYFVDSLQRITTPGRIIARVLDLDLTSVEP